MVLDDVEQRILIYRVAILVMPCTGLCIEGSAKRGLGLCTDAPQRGLFGSHTRFQPPILEFLVINDTCEGQCRHAQDVAVGSVLSAFSGRNSFTWSLRGASYGVVSDKSCCEGLWKSYVMRSFLSLSFFKPPKAIFVPGMYFLGFSRYSNCGASETI